MTRKEKLHDRADRLSLKLRTRGLAWDNAHDGFVAGYKAAMKDARKALAEGVSINSITPVEIFLKPIR